MYKTICYVCKFSMSILNNILVILNWGDGGAAHKIFRCTPPNRGQSRHVSRPCTRAHPRGHHQRHVDGGGKITLWRGRALEDGISEPPALATVFCCGKQGVAADCCRLRRVVRQRASPMGHLQCNYELPDDCTGKSARVQASHVWRNLAAVEEEVCTEGDGAGVQGRLR